MTYNLDYHIPPFEDVSPNQMRSADPGDWTLDSYWGDTHTGSRPMTREDVLKAYEQLTGHAWDERLGAKNIEGKFKVISTTPVE